LETVEVKQVVKQRTRVVEEQKESRFVTSKLGKQRWYFGPQFQ
jgi:hypothetical protein